MPNKSPRNLTAPDLVAYWKTIVNPHVSATRDGHLMKLLLERATPVQIMLGMYRYRGENLTVNQFSKRMDDWLEEDESWAEVELACYIENQHPPEYFIYRDLVDEENSEAYKQSFAARSVLKDWAGRILA